MHIESVKLSNFWCFGAEPSVFTLTPEVTALVGANGSGKTAAMRALSRMFGSSDLHRQIRRTDFHVPQSQKSILSGQELFVEAIFVFPELAEESPRDGAAVAVPRFFRNMTINDGGILKCRIRLDAKWTYDGTQDGAVEQQIYVINTLAEEFDIEANVQPLKAQDRASIRLVYVPAIRSSNPIEVLIGSFWRAISWSARLKDKYDNAAADLQSTFDAEGPVARINKKLNRRWHQVHTAATDTDVSLSPIEREFDAFVRKVDANFAPAPAGRMRTLEELSDGQRSLFYITMAASLLDLEAELQAESPEGFDLTELKFPALTILALEEPENNLSPFFMSRILSVLRDCASKSNVQCLVSTHSPSALIRVEPDTVRYFRRDASIGSSTVRSITLPDTETEEEAAKYIREAVKAFPELYFAKTVVLGEGDSEMIVIPRLAEALGLSLDPSFVAMVPLGGRHVNHFWRLLTDLEIPHVTLLDLDLGRSGGGWGRIKYACAQLYSFGAIDSDDYEESLELADEGGELDCSVLESWITWLRSHSVHFSSPLDLDFSMLEAFETEYCEAPPGGRGPNDDVDGAKKAVLKGEGDPDVYDSDWDDLFIWYRYLFLGRGKPTSHLAGLSRCSNVNLSSRIPSELKTLIEDISSRIESSNDDED